MRLGELPGLHAGDVVLDAAPVVHIERSLRRDSTLTWPKTTRPRRTITLTASTTELFAALLAGRQPDDLIFSGPAGAPWDAGNLRQKFWRPAVVAAQRCPQHPPGHQTDG